MSIAVVYDWPVATPGQTTPPATNQVPPTNTPSSGRFNAVTAALTGDGVTTTVTVTHNFQITAVELTQGWPEVRFEPQVSGAPSNWVIQKTTNNVTVGLSAAVATSVGVFELVRIFRPQSATK